MHNRIWIYRFGLTTLLVALFVGILVGASQSVFAQSNDDGDHTVFIPMMQAGPTIGTIAQDEKDDPHAGHHHVEDAGLDPSERIEEVDELGAFALSSRSVVIDPGHGYYRDGNIWRTQRSPITLNGKTYREDFGTINISKYVVQYLRAKGVKVYVTREINKNAGTGISGNPKWQEGAKYHLQSKGVSSNIWNNGFTGCRNFKREHCQDLYARPLYANSVGADIFVSIHSNAGGGTGTETFHAPGSSNGSKLAGKINNQVVNIARNSYPNWRNRGVKTQGFAVLTRTRMPAALIEVAFHDRANPDHAALVRDQFHRDTAKGICNGILEYFGERPTCGGNVVQPPKPDPKPQPPKPAYPICNTRPLLKYSDGFSSRPWNRDNVKALQSLMNQRHGYRLTVDGYFGNGTKSAVLNFQGKRFWLTNDGIVGSGTWKSLCYGL